MNFKNIVQIIICFLFSSTISALNSTENITPYFKIGLLEYSPGDWNSDETALSELSHFINNKTNISIIKIKRDNELKVKIGSDAFFKTKYPEGYAINESKQMKTIRKKCFFLIFTTPQCQ